MWVYLCSFLLAVGLCGALCWQTSGQAQAATDPAGNISDPAIQGVDLAKPAVVRIITTITSTIVVHFPQSVNVTFPQQAGNNYTIQLSGTGTFISAQGDLLTADHVVDPPSSQLNTTLYTQAAPDIATYMNKNAQAGAAQITSAQVVQELTSGTLKSDPTYSKPGSTVLVDTDYSGKTNAASIQNLPPYLIATVDKIEKESAPDQEDIAIVHVPLNDTLSVQLGNSANVQQADNLLIIGFPGDADVNNKPDDLLSSSINQIYVSSIKTSSSGAPLIQVGGNVEHGDSGGPALDSNGNIVGVVSFQLVTQGDAGNTSFLQASSSATSMIDSLKLNTNPGKQEQLWKQAFSDYVATTPGHWSKAVQDFNQLLTSYPNFKAASIYQSYAQTQSGGVTPTATATPQISTTPVVKAAKNKAAPIGSVPAIVLTIGALVVVVALVALFGVIMVRRKPAKAKRQKGTAPGSNRAGDKPKADNPGINGVGTVTQNPAQPGNIVQTPNTSGQTQDTLSLKIWPCGHMNRLNARFCSICGEPAPE